MTSDIIALKVEVPIACFRDSRSREFIATYPAPPPSTVYGMLLSTVGEVDRDRHCGVKLATAILSTPTKSRVLRKVHRFKNKDIYSPENTKPDYQELLTNIKLGIWIDPAEDNATPNLGKLLYQSMTEPHSITRFGNICLGESRDLVNSIDLLKDSDCQGSLQWMTQATDGELTLPYWVDHVGSEHTRCLHYTLTESLDWQVPPSSWTQIQSA